MSADIEHTLYSLEERYISKDLLQQTDFIAMEKLTDQQRKVFNLRRQGFTYKEIAEKFGIKEKTVEAHIYQSTRILRKYLTD